MDKEQMCEELVIMGMIQSPQWPEGLINDLCEVVIDYPEQEAK